MAQTLRIFVASTAEDLIQYRAAALEVIDRLGHKAVHMETFGAMPSWSLAACRELVAGCDAAVVIVGYRYGWVPSVREGGDGQKSITWHEVDAARAADVPLFAFLVDEKARWTEPREQDRLVEATDDAAAAAIRGSLQHLREFKRELGQRPVGTFSSPEDLAAKLSTSLSIWLTGAHAPYVDGGWWIHPQIGLRVPTPEGWRAREIMNNPCLIGPEGGGGFHDNINVQFLPMPGPADADDLLNQNVVQLQSIPTITVDAAEVRSVDGRGAAYLRYHGRLPGQDSTLHFACLMVIKGERQIVITMSVAEDRWPDRAALTEDVMSRLSFKAPSA